MSKITQNLKLRAYFRQNFMELDIPSSNLKNRTSFSPESKDESDKIMKSYIIPWPWSLGPRNYIWVTWAQKTYQAISQEPYLLRSNFPIQNLIFFHNNKLNQIKWSNLKKYLGLGVWELKTRFGPLGPKSMIKL